MMFLWAALHNKTLEFLMNEAKELKETPTKTTSRIQYA
jgi:hypothetical protein